jgi:hypothetical protein
MNSRLKKYRQVLGGGLVVLLGATTSTAFAKDADINFAGFASLVYAKTITDDTKEGTFYGMSNDGEYRDFNKLGFRMDVDMKDNLTFTAQVLAQGAENYDPTFDWIFATYQIHPEVAISAGRIRVPVFMYSDYIDTSYAYQWIEPPIAVYNLAQTPFRSIEGIKLAYTTNMGDWTSELLLWGGKGEDDFTESGVDADLILEDSLGAAWTVGYDWLSLRGFYFMADSSLDITTNTNVNALMGGLDSLETAISIGSGGAKNPDFDDALLWENDPGEFYGLGISMDFESFFIISEVTRIDVKGKESNLVAPTLDSYYITGGVRLPAQWTLSLTFSGDKDHVDEKTFEQFDAFQTDINNLTVTLPFVDSQLALLPQTPEVLAQRAGVQALIAATPQLQALPGAVKATVYSQQDFKSKETTLSARWDFHRSAALKLEYIMDEREGQFLSGQTLKPQALRVGLDLVF